MNFPYVAVRFLFSFPWFFFFVKTVGLIVIMGPFLSVPNTPRLGRSVIPINCLVIQLNKMHMHHCSVCSVSVVRRCILTQSTMFKSARQSRFYHRVKAKAKSECKRHSQQLKTKHKSQGVKTWDAFSDVFKYGTSALYQLTLK